MGPMFTFVKRVCGRLLGGIALMLILPAAAFALPDQTWVADYGSDSNVCSQASPCATFQGAIDKTAAGGEVDAETDGDFVGSGVVINNSITLNGNGHNVTVSLSSGQAIAVNEFSTADVVNLIGLTMNGFGTAAEGVYFPGGGTLRVENCDIYGFVFESIVNVTNGASRLDVDDTTMAGGEAGVYINEDGGQTTIDNSTIEDASNYGIEVLNSPGQAVIDDSSLDGNGYGIDVQSSAFYGTSAFQMQINGSTVDDNAIEGVYDGVGQMTLQNDEVDQNVGNGVEAGGGATVSSVGTTMADNTGTGVLSDAGGENSMTGDLVTGNAIGLQAASGGTIVLLGANNSVYGNTTNGTPTSTVTTGAVGPAGANGTNGANGAKGSTGSRGAAGRVELVSCKTVTKTKTVNGKKKRIKVQRCTGKLVSGSVKFTVAGRRAERATLSRGAAVYARGTATVARGRVEGVLTFKRRPRKGRYTLTLRNGHSIDSRSTVTMR